MRLQNQKKYVMIIFCFTATRVKTVVSKTGPLSSSSTASGSSSVSSRTSTRTPQSSPGSERGDQQPLTPPTTPLQVNIYQIEVFFFLLKHKMTFYCSAIVQQFTRIHPACSSCNLCRGVYVHLCKKVDNLMNNQLPYFGLTLFLPACVM